MPTEEAAALRRCISILAPLSTAEQRRTMSLSIEKRIRGQETALLAFRFAQFGALFYPTDAAKAAKVAQQMKDAAEAGDFVTSIPLEQSGAFVSDLAAWPDCPPLPEESPLRYWLSFMPKPEPAQAAPVVGENAEQRQARRWQMCRDAGLSMPQETYAQLPRGIKEIAKAERITRQALAQDLNAYRERLFGK